MELEHLFTGSALNAVDAKGRLSVPSFIRQVIERRSDGTVKASLRAKDPAYRVDSVAAKFNGGGHACAAGLSLKAGTEDFYARLVAALAERIAAVDATRKQ